MRKIIASLDIGSNSIKLIVGEFFRNSLNILCVSEVPSKGVKKGLVVKEEELIIVLKECFHKAEEILGLEIKEVLLNIPAYNVEVEMAEGTSSITNEEQVIGYQDLTRALHAASYNKIAANMELVSIIPTRYKVDEQIVKDPINMIGKKLSLKAALVSLPKTVVDPFIKVLNKIGVKVLDIVLASLGDYEANQSKMTNNSLGAIINIGSDLTTISVYNKGILMKTDILELGGANVDNDIAYIYKVTKKDAKHLKENMGLASSLMASLSETTNLTDRLGENVTINEADLSEIIESRLEEILNLAKKQLNIMTRKNLEYIIVTGGMSEIGDFNNLIDKVFTKSHILGKIDIVGVRNNKYSTVLGNIKYYNGKLKLENKEYSVFNEDELEALSGAHKKVNINENSVLGKLFGYFFDS